MKAILEFTLPEEKYEHKAALQGADLRLTVSNLDNMLRGFLKHGHSFKTATEALEAIRASLREDLDYYNINLNDE